MKKLLGNTGIEVSAIGLGCWPIGGTWTAGDGTTPLGYGETDDNESIKALQAALELGVNFFDTANIYGCGHSEKILGQAFKDRREDVVLATKFSSTFDEDKKLALGSDNSKEGIIKACNDSLRRLGTDYIDLYLFHDYSYHVDKAEEVRLTLEGLVKEGKIRSYGWSTDLIPSVKAFNKTRNNAAVEVGFNVFEGNTPLLKYCEDNNLTAMARSPLAMGLLSNKYDASTVISGKDIRSTDMDWMTFFQNGRPSLEYINRRDAIKEILASEGRTVTQGALAWLLGRSDNLIPIPGFKGIKQAVENAKVLEFGPMSKDQVTEVENLVNFTTMFV